jgi:hypothetical protein
LPDRGDRGHATAYEIGHDRRQAIVLTCQPVVLNDYVLALDVTGFVEALAERRRKARTALGRPSVDEPDHRYRRLLRLRRERPRRSAAKEGDKLTTLQSMEMHPLPLGNNGSITDWQGSVRARCTAAFRSGL